MEIVPLGDSALIVRVVDDFARDPEASLNAVLAALRALEAAAISGVTGLAPAYATIGVSFDVAEIARAAPGDESFVWLRSRIESVLTTRPVQNDSGVRAPLIEIPVCYAREFAPDIDDVARAAGLAEVDVIHRHSSAAYRVNCVGFTPGFPFLSGLPPELATPRRAVPRKNVPAGSVGIGGTQTGIYPLKSPGGWNLIGRTPLRVFDIKQDPPTLLQAGDHVRFRAISREEFDASL